MTPPMLRSLMAFGLVSLAAGHAAADDAIGDTGATLGWPEVDVRAGFAVDGELREPEDGEEFRQHLNLAACTCSATSTDFDTKLYYQLTLDRETGRNIPVEIVTGTECDRDEVFDINCHVVEGSNAPGDIDSIFLSTGDTFVEVPLFDLINPRDEDRMAACNQLDGGLANVWAIMDSNQDGQRDVFSVRPIDLSANGKYPDVTGFDTKPPPLPDSIRATGGENSIDISWSIPTSNNEDLYAYQALCATTDDAAVKSGATPLYSTTDTICGIPQVLDLAATDPGGDGTEIPAALASFSSLDRAFICGTQESATATSIRIEGLENGVEYKVALVAIDFYGNPTGTFFTRTITPQPVTDFWEDIHDRGGKVEGGLCSTNGGDALPGLVIPLALAFLIRRRKKLATLAVVGSIGAMFASSSTASADDFTPYWEDPSNTTESGAEIYEDHVKWHVGIKLGPYTPAIDEQFKDLNATNGTSIGPYQAMFGNYYTDDDGDGMLESHDKRVYQFLPMLDVERVIWSGSGQVAVGGTLGYMQKRAFAYADGSTPAEDPFRVRTRAASNTFRLIPFALTASYRATQLDDLWGIPVVPYLRGGLSYYVWWMKGPNGNLSKICTDGTTDSGCKGNKAYGGSLGFQGALGLSIRAERIDAAAARSMKQSGIYHAGFYVELMAAIVNGFGDDKKLSVGDKTWFGGFDFEF